MRAFFRALLAVLIIALGVTAPVATASAAGTPDLALQKSVSETTLYGEDVQVTLTATNSTGTDGYNLTFTDVIPAGASITSSSPIAPTEQLVLPSGDVLVVWANVADSIAGTSVSLTYSYDYPTATYAVGETFAGDAGAYANDNPRFVPDVELDDVTGEPVYGDYTGFDTAGGSTQLVPFEVIKREPSEETELLRGVHDHKTVYEIEIRNNLVTPSTDFDVIDWLPAGLEFLGCTNVDNSTPGETEYPGSGRIDDTALPAMANCIEPDAVETVSEDPDGAGPMPDDVYTKVTWSNLGDIPAGGSIVFQYAAAIPLQENEVDAATDAAGATANLDNNTGDLTRDEQALVNHVAAGGTNLGNDYEVTDRTQVTAEDVSIHKRTSTTTIAQGGVTEWTLFVENSEYAVSTDSITVVDTIPDGLGFTETLTAVDEDSVVTNGAADDHTQTVQWTLPGFTSPSDDQTIRFTTTTLTTYRAGGPVAAEDSWTNRVALETDAEIIDDESGATDVLPIVDASQAGQSAPGITIEKVVAEPTGTDDCTGTPNGDWAEQSGPFTPGDRVCFRLSVDFPDDLDTLNTRVVDFLPAGFTYEDFTYTGANDITATSAPSAGDGPRLVWQLPDADTGDFFQIIVAARITDAEAAATGDITANLMKLRYRNTDGAVFQLRDQADVEWALPVLDLEKGVVDVDGTPVDPPADGVEVQADSEVTYRVTVENTGDTDATDVEVRDVLPTGIACADVTDAGGAACVDDVLRWTVPTIAAGDSVDLEYTVQLPGSVSPSDSFTNTAGVRTYEVATNDGGSFPYFPADNIDPTVPPGDINTEPVDDDSDVVVPDLEFEKTVVSTGLTEGGNNTTGQVTIGETVTWELTLTVPEGTTLYGGPVIYDLVPAQYRIEGTPTFTVDGGAPASAIVSGNDVAAFFSNSGSSYVNAPGSGDDDIVLTITATLLDQPATDRGDDIANIGFYQAESQDGTLLREFSEPTTRVVEPNVSVEKTTSDPDGVVEPGSTVDYSITVRNGSGTNVSTAHDIEFADVLPDDFTAVSWDPALDYDPVTNTLSGTIASLAPGASETYGYSVEVANPTDSAQQLENTVTVVSTSTPGANADERDYTTDDSVTVTAPNVAVTKSVADDRLTIGETARYTLEVSVPADVRGYDLTVLDDLPSGLVFDGIVGTPTCEFADGTTCGLGAEVIGTPASSGDTIGFWIGDFAPSGQSRTVTIVYDAWVDDTADRGDVLPNSATAYFDETDAIGGTPGTNPDPADFTFDTPPASVDVDVVEPTLTVDKRVNGQVGDSDTRRAKPGQTLTYTIAVRNTGNAPAHDVVVSDTPDARLTGFANTGAGTVVDGDPSDGALEWIVAGPIAPGATTTVSYTLTVPTNLGPSDEVTGAEVVNTADAPEYWGVAEDDRDAEPGRDYVDYDDVTPDTVSVELDLAVLGDTLWFDVDGDGVIDADEPRLEGVDVTVRFAGADGIFGGADDEVETVTTDADGRWEADRLPGGSYRVIVDAADIPWGLTPSYDLDGGTTSPDGQWTGILAEGATKLDVDFGYTGTGSIGDHVWFDQNTDGVIDPNEGGIAGVDITVTWLGPDGVPGGGDDLVYTAVTDANGDYLIDNLPAGEYTVEVSAPTGYDVVSGPNGADASVSTTLGGGELEFGMDFGFAGDGELGDLVWLDRDGGVDGVYDGDDRVVKGQTLEITFFGTDPGAGDDTVITVTTDDDGEYLAQHLPPGSYSVAIVGGIALLADATYDENDGTTAPDGVTTVTLADGASHLTADFGYRADSAIGDLVWLDRDGDGVQDAGEPGIPGVTVTVTSPGPNGTYGDSDDTEYTTETDADGAWAIGDLPNGDYRVEISGYGNALEPTSDPDGSAPADGESDLVLAGTDLTQDFGLAGPGSIGDTVWFDRNGDGVQQAEEPGIAGVTVGLVWLGPDGVLGGGDDLEFEIDTDADGEYTFDGLPLGDYLVRVDPADLPLGMGTPTYDLDGVGTAATAALTLTAGSPSRDDADFGWRGTGSIGDNVWFDDDADGLRDPGEAGMDGVDVRVTWFGPDGVSGGGDDATFTVTTDDGLYGVGGLPAGSFSVELDGATVPAGYTVTHDEDGDLDFETPVTLAPGQAHLTADFGLSGTQSVGDLVWLDLNGDGDQDAGEPGIPGQTVRVTWLGPDGVLGGGDDLVFEDVTDADGAWSIPNMLDGDYIAEVVDGIADDPSVTTTTAPSPFTLTGTGSNDVDFGFVGANALGNRVWWDRNGDGVDDAGEPGLGGIDLEAVWSGPDGDAGTADDVTFALATASDGSYSLDGLPDGDYTVTVTGTVPGAMVPSSDPQGALDGSASTTLTGGETDDSLDFGYSGSGAIGDTVWLDRNGNGVQDAEEPGIPGVTVTIDWQLDIDGTGVQSFTATATTDEFGQYLFPALPVAATGYTVWVSGTPANLATVSDPDGTNDGITFVVLGPGEIHLTADFGYQGFAGVGDLVWLDVDRDGVQTGNEPGVPGLPISVATPGVDGLLGTVDDVIVQTVTDAAGGYLVEGLPAGPVRVSYDLDDLDRGYEPVSDLDGDDATVAEAVLVDGPPETDVDFVIGGTARLVGTIFEDTDQDGVQDRGEPGVPGVDVIITWDGPDGPVEIVVTTDDDGDWRLPDLPPGDYGVDVDDATVPDGYEYTTPDDVEVTLPPGGVERVDVGVVPESDVLASTGGTLAWIAFVAILLAGGGAVLMTVAAWNRRRA